MNNSKSDNDNNSNNNNNNNNNNKNNNTIILFIFKNVYIIYSRNIWTKNKALALPYYARFDKFTLVTSKI